MAEELYFSPDGKSLKRGKRGAKRRPIDRRVEMWRLGEEDQRVEGTATDISLDGLMIRAPADFTIGEEIMVDVRRGKELDTPTFLYARARVVRIVDGDAGGRGFGLRLVAKERKPA